MIFKYKIEVWRPIELPFSFWFRYPSPRAYITARLTAVDSKLPAADRRNITDMMVSLASAEHCGMDKNLAARLEASYLLETEKQPFGRVSVGAHAG